MSSHEFINDNDTSSDIFYTEARENRHARRKHAKRLRELQAHEKLNKIVNDLINEDLAAATRSGRRKARRAFNKRLDQRKKRGTF